MMHLQQDSGEGMEFISDLEQLVLAAEGAGIAEEQIYACLNGLASHDAFGDDLLNGELDALAQYAAMLTLDQYSWHRAFLGAYQATIAQLEEDVAAHKRFLDALDEGTADASLYAEAVTALFPDAEPQDALLGQRDDGTLAVCLDMEITAKGGALEILRPRMQYWTERLVEQGPIAPYFSDLTGDAN